MAKILVVEDDLTVGKVVETILTFEGHAVTLARDAAEGRREIEAGGHVLVVLDINMPKGTGLELLDRIRKDLGRDTPVLMLSAQTQEQTVVRALELGANDYVTKPFSPRELVARVNRWIGGTSHVASVRG